MLFSSWNLTSNAYNQVLQLKPFAAQEMHVLKVLFCVCVLDGETSEFMVVSLENVTWHFDASSLEV